MVHALTALRLEVAKMRRLRLAPVALILASVSVALSLPVSAAQRAALSDTAQDPWPHLLLAISMAVALVSPILTAVLASRLVDVEHTGGGWNLAAASGLSPGSLCRAKVAALTLVIAPVSACQVGLPALAACQLGAVGSPRPSAWSGYLLSLLALDLAWCALHVLLATWVDNQIICVGAGFLGSFVSLFCLLAPPWAVRLLPWGYWAMVTPVQQSGEDGVTAYASVDWPWVAGFLVLVAAVFLAATARLNRIER
ncbi:ABC transporter permease [Actinomyces urogenitalis]|uniref:ABC transporter permease n=1 Tax=Actinomyces urogenitalis TaxID=103621 RepID=UPI00242CD857|nr:ABC transporter permease [Actinomyces urogenitalis]MCI7456309.1 ABC transporter permease [Actinomyces urogenitalis]